MSATFRAPAPDEQALLASLQVRLLEPAELGRCHQLLDQHHYLKSPKPVGERLYYVVTDGQGQWLALLVFAAAARHLRHRDRWIGWTEAQRERRLSLVVNNIRFLLLPDRTFPNLGTRSLRLGLARLSQRLASALWASGADRGDLCRSRAVLRHGLYRQRLGGVGPDRRLAGDISAITMFATTSPNGSSCGSLVRNARRSLQAEHLKPALARVEAKAGVRSRHTDQRDPVHRPAP